MQYILKIDVIHPVPEVEITEEEFIAYGQAKKILDACFSIEEKYELLMTNFLDFEKELLSVSAGHMVRRTQNYSQFFQILTPLNVRIVNLLTSVRLYQDQVRHEIGLCVPGDNEALESIKSLFSHEYDSNFEYRFMEALRNYTQHCGLPIHHLAPTGAWSDIENPLFQEFNCDIFALKSRLNEDSLFKRSVLAESSDSIDLKYCARKYIQSISSVNEDVRMHIAGSVKGARKLLDSAHEMYSELYSENTLALCAVRNPANGEKSKIALLTKWDDVRIELIERNARLGNVAFRNVTSAVRGNTKEVLLRDGE
jgi:hypothetical protein